MAETARTLPFPGSEAAPAALHMVQLQFSTRDIARSAKDQGIPTAADDLGYVLHGHLRALFGDLAPKPFHVKEQRGRVVVLGYTDADPAELSDHLSLADPFDARSVQDLATKPMPSTWTEGRRLAFEVRVCPTIRQGRKELDAYLAEVQRLAEGEKMKETRETVYVRWLTEKLGDAVKVESCGLDRFRLIQLFRRHQADASGKRGHQLTRFPSATLKGVLDIKDGDAFARLLSRGVGRHRAFGFGMMLVRPAPRNPGC